VVSTPAGRYFLLCAYGGATSFQKERSHVAEAGQEVNPLPMGMIDLGIEQSKLSPIQRSKQKYSAREHGLKGKDWQRLWH
jgi:hypothetical protein